MAKKRKIKMKEPEQKEAEQKEAAAPAAEAQKLPNKPDEELRKLAMDYCEGKIFTSHGLGERDIMMVFMGVALGAFKDWSKEQIEQIGFIYEYMGEAGPWACNGKPMFLSFRILNKEDAMRFGEYVNLLQAQKQAFLQHKTQW